MGPGACSSQFAEIDNNDPAIVNNVRSTPCITRRADPESVSLAGRGHLEDLIAQLENLLAMKA